MDPNRWQQVWSVFEAALNLPSDKRDTFLDNACANDSGVRREVVSLLEAHERPALIDGSPDELVAPLVASLRASGSLDGQTVAQYQVLEKLGKGGMGVVYKGYDTRLKRTVALKFLPPYLSDDTQAKERFLIEARAAAALEHANICTIYEIGEAKDGRLFIVMPYYDGETLKAKIRQGPLPVEYTLQITLQIAKGLAKAHEHGIIHRDIKPANVMITPEEVIKILDFGVAKVTDVDLTTTGTRIGTLVYMSPEQVGGQALDHRTDIWSLGVVLYEMLTGRRPFAGDYEDAIRYAIQNERPEPVRTLRPEVPEAVENIVNKALAKEPQARYAAVQDLTRDAQKAPSLKAETTSDAVGTREEQASIIEGTHRSVLSEGERVQATLVVSSLSGYIDLVEALPTDAFDRVLKNIRDTAIEIVQRHSGIVNDFSGEEIVMLFGIPTPHEDDSIRAVRMARELHAGIRKLNAQTEHLIDQPIHLQTGLDTGLVIARQQDGKQQPYHVAGRALRTATRLALHAEPDEILVSPSSRRLITPYFETEAGEPLRLKGARKRLTPYRVTGVSRLKTHLEAAEQTGLTAFTGREHELHTLKQNFILAEKENGQFITVVGEAGLGKSRLLHEFCQPLLDKDIMQMEGRCRPYGEHTPLLPFVEVLRQQLLEQDVATDLPSEDAVAARVEALDPDLKAFTPLYLHLLSVQSDRYPLPEHLEGEGLRLAVLDGIAAFITLSSRHRPVVLTLEDWHWSDEASRDVLSQLIEMASVHALLLVVTYRPTYTADWSNLDHHTPIRLKPFAAASTAALLSSIFQVNQIPEVLADVLHERTGGNPFFLEEICHTLREEGIVRVETGCLILTRPVEQFHLPNRVEAVIRTRLHRLERPAQNVLRLASVVGREFDRSVLQHVLPEEPPLMTSLEALREAGLIQRIRVFPEATYRFKHALTQEVAYESLLKHQRKTLHGQVGEALEALYPERAEEQTDLLAHHFSQAEAWPNAVHFGQMAAERAINLSQYAEALGMLEKVQTWLMALPEDGAQRAALVDVLFHQERICEIRGERDRQQQLIDELFGLHAEEDAPRLAEVYIRQGELDAFQGDYNKAEAALTKALQLSRHRSDATVERKVLTSMGFVLWRQNRIEDAIEVNEQVLAMDRELQDLKALAVDLANLATILHRAGMYDKGLVYAEESISLGEKAMLHTDDDTQIYRYTAALTVASALYLALGNEKKAEELLQKTLALTQVSGHRPYLWHSTSYTKATLSGLYMQQGKLRESAALLEEAVQGFRKVRFLDGLTNSLHRLGQVLSVLERHDEAVPHFQEAAELYKKLKQPENEAQMWSLAARSHEQQADPDSALAAWENAHRLYMQIHHTRGTLEAVEGLARLMRRQGKADVAQQHYRDALALAERLDDRARQGDLHNTLGIFAWQAERYAEARTHYEAALVVFEELGDDVHAGLMHNSLGVTFRKLEDYEAAIQHLEAGIVLHRHTGQKRLEAHALAALGDIYLDRAQYADSLPYYGASLQLRWDLDDRKGEGWLLHQLARVYAATGDTDQAHGSIAQATKIASEINDVELQKACERLRLNYL